LGAGDVGCQQHRVDAVVVLGLDVGTGRDQTPRFGHVAVEGSPLQRGAAVGLSCIHVLAHIGEDGGGPQNGGRYRGRDAIPGISHYFQTSITPLESPNFSRVTPARCAIVSRMFACGVSLGIEMCCPPLIPPPLPAISCGSGWLLCRSLLAMFEPNSRIELARMLPLPSLISDRRLMNFAKRSVW